MIYFPTHILVIGFTNKSHINIAFWDFMAAIEIFNYYKEKIDTSRMYLYNSTIAHNPEWALRTYIR